MAMSSVFSGQAPMASAFSWDAVVEEDIDLEGLGEQGQRTAHPYLHSFGWSVDAWHAEDEQNKKLSCMKGKETRKRHIFFAHREACIVFPIAHNLT